MYPQVFGKYVLEKELSRGGMARVILATLRGAGGFEKRLVVKQIRDELSFDQQFIRRFVEEAKTTVALSHPNIVPVYELGVEQGTYFLAMELVEGCSIAEVVRERNEDGTKRVLTPEEGAYVGMELCRALDYAHRRMKVVHRDITPRNVMLDEEGQVKLIDFGIAAPALVAGHEILGSPGHMPPEQVEGKELGPATDIFAVAVLLMEGWTGIAPFRRATPEDCDLAMREEHPKPSDFDPRLLPLDEVVGRAMKLDPKERQQDANDLGRALRAFLQGTDVTDIARALGDRVRDLRQALGDPSPRLISGEVRLPNPSVGELGTQTFAAREEAVRWSSPSADEIEPPGASTRKLPEVPVGVDTPMGETPVAAPAIMKTPTPLVIEPSEIEARGARSAKRAEEIGGVGGGAPDHEAAREAAREARAAKSEKSAERVDTLATRPLATEVRDKDGARAEPATQRSRTWSFVALVAVLAIGVGIAWRAKSSGREGPSGSTTTSATPTSMTSTSTATPSATHAASTPSAASSVMTPPPTTTVPASASPAGTHVTPPTSASAAEKAGRALVTFHGDPGTRVSIDGASRGPCPVRVSLEPGQHDVRFQFDPTGESRGERFSVKANEKVTVRADFTGASPTVRIQR